MINYKSWMSLLQGRCGRNATQAVIDSETIFLELPQFECGVEVCKESALEFPSGRLKRIKDVQSPSLNRREANRSLWDQVFVEHGNGTASVQEWVQDVFKSV